MKPVLKSKLQVKHDDLADAGKQTKMMDVCEEWGELKATGKTELTFNEYVGTKPKKGSALDKLRLTPRGKESPTETSKAMFAKMDQLIELPDPKREINPMLQILKFQAKTRIGLIKQKVVMINRLMSMARRCAKIPSDATTEEIEIIGEEIGKKLVMEYNSVVKVKSIIEMKEVTYRQLNGEVKREFIRDYYKNPDNGTLIDNEFMFDAVESYVDFIQTIANIEARMEPILIHFPIWTHCLSHIKGVGPVTGAMFLAHMDINRADTPGSFLRRLGITVEEDGKGTSRRKEHNVPSVYIDSTGHEAIKWSLGYDGEWRAWFLSQMMGNLIKQGQNNLWRKPYIQKKFYYQSLPKHAKTKKVKGFDEPQIVMKDGKHVPNDGHINKMAIRYMAKIFICDVWLYWAALEGKQIKLPYYEQQKINGMTAEERKLHRTHQGRTGWELMLERLGNPLDVRAELYGKHDSIPTCYTIDPVDGSEIEYVPHAIYKKHHIVEPEKVKKLNAPTEPTE